MEELFNQVLAYLRGIWRNRWYAVVAAWGVCVLGWIAVYLIPDRYEATGTVYVNTDTMLKPLMSGLAVQPNVDQKIVLMTRAVVSRANLARVAHDAELDTNLSADQIDSLVDSMLKKVELVGSRDNLYKVTFQHSNPETARRVVDSLLKNFADSSLVEKRKDADDAKRFLDAQLKVYEQKLQVAENAVKEFKRKHVGLTPGRDGGYFERLKEAGEVLNKATLELREQEMRRDELKRQLSGEEPVLITGLSDTPTPPRTSKPAQHQSDVETIVEVPENTALKAIEGRIRSVQQKLDGMMLTFTAQHPDVILQKRVLAQLEAQKRVAEHNAPKPIIKTRRKSPSGERAPSRPVDNSSTLMANFFQQQMGMAQADAEANVALLKTRVSEYQKRYDELKAAADAAPEIEVEYTQLLRDYEVNKTNYAQLLHRRDQAQMTDDMESKQIGLEFRVIEPPRVPTHPAAPNRPLFLSLVLVAGIAAGVALAFLVSQINRTIDGPYSLKEFEGLPLLGTISPVWTDAHQQAKRKGLVAYALSVASLISAYAMLMAAVMLATRIA